MVAMPGEPNSMPATASAMYELKRYAHWNIDA
jgi:hypothetical protein